MARRNQSRYRRSSRGESQEQAWLAIIIVVGVLAGIIAIVQEIEAHLIEFAASLLAVCMAVYFGYPYWRRVQQAQAEEALRVQQAQAEEARREHEAYLARISTLKGLLSLTPTAFELTVGELLTFQGCTVVEHTGGPGDLAADLICRDSQGLLTVVQCKRYAVGHPVSSPEMQQFVGMIYAHHRADRGIFVTTSSFTEPALTLASQQNIKLLDGNDLVALVQQWQHSIHQEH